MGLESTKTEKHKGKRKGEKKLKGRFFLSHSPNIGSHNIGSLTSGERQTDWKDDRIDQSRKHVVLETGK